MERPTLFDHQVGIYSLGVVFYEMLTGQLPTGRSRPPSEHSESPPQLDPIVLRSLEHEPDRRHQSVADLKSDVVDGEPRTFPSPRRRLERERENYRRQGRREARERMTAILAPSLLVAAGLLAVCATRVSADLVWSYLGMPLLAPAVASAWLPVLLMVNAAIALLIETLVPHLAGISTDVFGA